MKPCMTDLRMKLQLLVRDGRKRYPPTFKSFEKLTGHRGEGTFSNRAVAEKIFLGGEGDCQKYHRKKQLREERLKI